MPDLTDPEVREALSDRDGYLGEAARRVEEQVEEDVVDFEDDNDGGDDSGGNKGDRKNGETTGPSSDGTLTNIEGPDGYRLTEEQLQERKESGNTDDLAPATAGGGGSFTPEERRENFRDEIVNQATEYETKDGSAGLTNIEGSSGFRLSKQDFRDRLKSGDVDDLAAAVPGQAGLPPEEKNELAINLAQTSRQEKRQERQRQKKSRDKSLDQIIQDFAENNQDILPPGQRAPAPNRMSAEAPETPNTLFSTQREFASGTNIPGETFLDRDVSFSGLPGTGIEGSAFGNRAFSTPAAFGFKVSEDTTDLLKTLGANERFSENVGTSAGATTTLGLGALAGIGQLPKDAREFAENPSEKVGSELDAFSRANTGKIADTPDQAVLFAGTDLQEQASLVQEAVGAGIGLSGIGSAAFGISSGGAVRGVNAPTIGKRNPNIEVKAMDVENFNDRVSAADTSVGPEGQVRLDQRFTDPTDTRSFGLIGEEETVGRTTTGGQFFKVDTPEGERTVLTDTEAAFRQKDEQVEGLSRTDILQIGEDNQLASGLSDSRIQSLGSELEDFRFDISRDENVLFQSPDRTLSNVEAAVRGESGNGDFSGISQANIEQDRNLGTVEIFSSSKPGGVFQDRSDFGTDVLSGSGRFIDEERFETPGIDETFKIDANDEPVDLTELSEQRQREFLEQVSETGDEIFGSQTRQPETDRDGEVEDVVEGFDEEVESGDQILVERTESGDGSELDQVTSERLGIGTDRAAGESASEAVRRAFENRFDEIDPGSASGSFSTGFLGGEAATSTETESLTEVSQDQRQNLREQPGQEQRPRNEVDFGLGQGVGQTSDTSQNLIQETETETGTVQRQRDLNVFRGGETVFKAGPRGPFGGGGLGRFKLDDDSDSRDSRVFGGTEVDRDPEATPSLDALLTGQKTEENIDDDTVFSGFETREVSQETDDVFKGLF